MTQTTITVNGAERTVITADEGKVLQSLDGLVLAKQIVLGIFDRAENYEEVDEPTKAKN